MPLQSERLDGCTESKKPLKKSERRRLERERELLQAQEAQEAERQALRGKLSRRLGNVPLVMSSAHFLHEIFYKTIIAGWNEDAQKQAVRKRGKSKAAKKLVANSARRRELRANVREYLKDMREAVADYVFSQPIAQLEGWMEAFINLDAAREKDFPSIFGIATDGLHISTPSEVLNEAIGNFLFLADTEETVGYAVEYLTWAMLVSVLSCLRYNFSVESLGMAMDGQRETVLTTLRIFMKDSTDEVIWRGTFGVKLTAVAAAEGRSTPFDH